MAHILASPPYLIEPYLAGTSARLSDEYFRRINIDKKLLGGIFFARVLPDWGFTVFGTRHSPNLGPWSYKEQMFATIIFNISNIVGGAFQQLPQYLNQKWVTFGYEVMLALSTQFFGLGFVGLLRRFVIYLVTTIRLKNFPTLALNRALVVPEKKSEVVNG
ncbi:OPT-domain-containing protein [Acephala macrosclerotiorum]|nr:OPT-domain-containing protein [Acephala macrosclerotiorum]